MSIPVISCYIMLYNIKKGKEKSNKEKKGRKKMKNVETCNLQPDEVLENLKNTFFDIKSDSALTVNQRNSELVKLMNFMEGFYKIPMLYEDAVQVISGDVLELYRDISMERHL